MPELVQRYGVTYPILVPPAESALANAIESLPTTFLLDRQGRVARTWVGALRASDRAAIEGDQPAGQLLGELRRDGRNGGALDAFDDIGRCGI